MADSACAPNGSLHFTVRSTTIGKSDSTTMENAAEARPGRPFSSSVRRVLAGTLMYCVTTVPSACTSRTSTRARSRAPHWAHGGAHDAAVGVMPGLNIARRGPNIAVRAATAEEETEKPHGAGGARRPVA